MKTHKMIDFRNSFQSLNSKLFAEKFQHLQFVRNDENMADRSMYILLLQCTIKCSESLHKNYVCTEHVDVFEHVVKN